MVALAQGIYRTDLRDQAVAALLSADTMAGINVFAQRSWSLRPGQYPAILVSTPLERKEALSTSAAGASTFDTTITLSCSLRTAANPDRNGTSTADTDLELFCCQVEDILLTALWLVTDANGQNVVQNIASVDTQFSTSVEGGPVLGEASVIFTVVVRQQYQPVAVPLLEIQAQTLDQSGAQKPLFDLPLPQA